MLLLPTYLDPDPCTLLPFLLLQMTLPFSKKSEVTVAMLCPTVCDPMDYTVRGIRQARILEWVAFPFSRGSSQPRDRMQFSHIVGRFFTSWATREVSGYIYIHTYTLFFGFFSFRSYYKLLSIVPCGLQQDSSSLPAFTELSHLVNLVVIPSPFILKERSRVAVYRDSDILPTVHFLI